MVANVTYVFQLILATTPDALHSKSPSILTEENINLLFEIQKKVLVPLQFITLDLHILYTMQSDLLSFVFLWCLFFERSLFKHF